MGNKSVDVIIRPGDQRVSTERIGQYSPDVLRHNAILKLAEGPATLTRISREQIILEALVDAAERLGYQLPATRRMIESARLLSPGLDGLGRGEMVKCLVAHAQAGSMFPASAFAQDMKPSLWQRMIGFFTGKKQTEGS